MALVNFTLPFGNTLPIQPWTTISPLQRHATAINNMLYDPAGHQQHQQQHQQQADDGDGDDYYDEYKHDPYAPPAVPHRQQLPPQRHQAYRRTGNGHNDYLPPAQQQQPQPPQRQHQQYQPQRSSPPGVRNLYLPQPPPPAGGGHNTGAPELQPSQLQPPHQQYYNNVNQQQQHQQTLPPHRVTYPQSIAETSQPLAPPPPPAPPITERTRTDQRVSGGGPSREHTVGLVDGDGLEQPTDDTNNGGYPSQVPTYTRVQAGAGAHTQVHAVLDYDDDGDGEDYDDVEDDGK